MVHVRHLQILVHENDSRRDFLQQHRRFVVRHLAHVRHAHVFLSPPVQHGKREIPATVIAAAAAIQFVFRAGLADSGERLHDFRLGILGRMAGRCHITGADVHPAEVIAFPFGRPAETVLNAVTLQGKRPLAQLGRTIDTPPLASQQLQENGIFFTLGIQVLKHLFDIIQIRERHLGNLFPLNAGQHAPLKGIKGAHPGAPGDKMVLR